jgi:hypothetical protein
VRVPNDIEPGKATITVSVPAWKDRVTSLQIEIPVVTTKPVPEKAAPK